MAVKEPTPRSQGGSSNMVIDKKWLQEKFAEMDARNGVAAAPIITIEQLHAMMIANGVRPENNEASREILRDRYPDDVQDEQEQA